METGLVKSDTGEIVDTNEMQVSAHLTGKDIALIKQDMELAERLVSTVLKQGIDYGQTPGTSGMGLWDAGAAKIIRAYRTHVEHKVLYHEETEDLITWTIESLLIDNASGHIVGSGLGSCSTREGKYGFRWVEKPEDLGYTQEEIEGMRAKVREGSMRYRVANPDVGDLSNTILVQAAKRSEVDAAKTLPGVVAALKPILDPDARRAKPTTTAAPPQDWGRFWSIVKSWGLTEDVVHKALGVTSIKDYIAKGKTTDDGIRELGTMMNNAIQSAKRPVTTKPSQGAAPAPKPKTVYQIVASDVPDIDALLRLAKTHWALDELDVFVELGYPSRDAFTEAGLTSPWEAFLTLKDMHSKPE